MALLLLIGYLAINSYLQALEILVTPVFLFVHAAFGMDWVSKQTTFMGNNVPPK